MITLSIDEKDPHVLRVSASYLLALASEPMVTAEIANHVANVHNSLVDHISGDTTFNVAELAEATRLGESAPAPDVLDAASIFGGKPSDAPFIAGAGASQTAPADTTAITEIPTPPVDVPNVPVGANADYHAVPATTNLASGVEVDVRGLPWDARINSREKTKLANGNWKHKRGVDDHMITKIEKELKHLMAIPAPPPLPHAEVVIAPPSTPVVPVPPAITAPPANPSSANPVIALMQKVTAALSARTITQAEVVAITQSKGVQALPMLIQRPDLVPEIEQLIDITIASNVAGGVPV